MPCGGHVHTDLMGTSRMQGTPHPAAALAGGQQFHIRAGGLAGMERQIDLCHAQTVAGIPATLPALAWAQKSWRRAVEAGIRADDLASPIDEQVPADEDQLAEQLLALVIAAESQGWDAEASLRGRVRELHRNIQQAESDMRQAETGMRPAEAGFGPGESRLGGAP